MKGFIGKELVLEGVIITPYTSLDEETGEISHGATTTIITDNFTKAIVTSSKTVYFKIKELLDLFRLHLDLFDENQRIENRPFKPLRRFFKIYVRGIKGAADLRHRLMETNSTDEVRAMLDAFEAQMETEI